MAKPKVRTVSRKERHSNEDIPDVSRAFWLKHVSHEERNIEELNPAFWTHEKAAGERLTRTEILRRGDLPIDNDLADLLEEAPDGKPASVGCCPLFARQFQRFFSDAAMRIHNAQEFAPYCCTLLNPIDRARFWQLDEINWRSLQARLRKQLSTVFGKDVVAFGVGEISYVEKHRQWQPHFHVVVYGTSTKRRKRLRLRYYTRWIVDKKTKERKKNNTWLGVRVRRMVKSTYPLAEFPRWLSYMSKLNTFESRKIPGRRPETKRLPEDASRVFFRYLARRRPTSFVFCMNCRIVKQRR